MILTRFFYLLTLEIGYNGVMQDRNFLFWLRIIVSVFLVVAVALAGWYYYAKWREKQDLRDVVLRYTGVLGGVFSSSKTDLIESVTTINQKNKMDMYVMMLKQVRKVRMETGLEELEFVSVKRGVKEKSKLVKGIEDTGLVKTKETWWYKEFDLETGKVLTPKQSIRYTVTYDLVLTEGRWLIDNIMAKETNAREQKGGKS